MANHRKCVTCKQVINIDDENYFKIVHSENGSGNEFFCEKCGRDIYQRLKGNRNIITEHLVCGMHLGKDFPVKGIQLFDIRIINHDFPKSESTAQITPIDFFKKFYANGMTKHEILSVKKDYCDLFGIKESQLEGAQEA